MALLEHLGGSHDDKMVRTMIRQDGSHKQSAQIMDKAKNEDSQLSMSYYIYIPTVLT